MEEPHITYEELIEVSSMGVFAMDYKNTSICDSRYNELKPRILSECPIEGAYLRGFYSGSPGRDIYLMLPYLTDDQMGKVADVIVSKFPTCPPGNHVNVAVFIRYLYGQNEKNGIFHSKKYFKESQDADKGLILPRKFSELLHNRFENNDNFYGRCILSEMDAHRYGDEAVMYRDVNKLKHMEKLYNESVEYAFKCKSLKHMFTPYYWAFTYFKKFKNKEKAADYACLMLKNASIYCPDSRKGYKAKVKQCVKFLKKDDKVWQNIRKQCLEPSSNKCVKKVIKSIEGKIGK